MSNKTPQGSTNRQAGDVAAITVRKDPTGKRQRENEVWKRIAEEGTPTVLSHEWQAQICEKARRNGFIALDHLVYILATDERYTGELLSPIWKEYQLAKRGPAEPDLSTAQSRAGVWQALLHRWAFGMVAGTRGGLDAIKYLPGYTFNPENGELEDYDRKAMTKALYVKLNEMEEYFKSLEISLPSPLFAETKDKATTATSEIKLRPCQKHKKACREVASKIWKSDPEKTIADLAFSDEISNACGKKVYTESTIRRWIKDLCPNRKPGRRPQKKS